MPASSARQLPSTLSVRVYEGDAWSLPLNLRALGDLTGQTILVKFRAKGAKSSTTIGHTSSPEDLTRSIIRIGQSSARPGAFSVHIGARTYVVGTVSVMDALT